MRYIGANVPLESLGQVKRVRGQMPCLSALGLKFRVSAASSGTDTLLGQFPLYTGRCPFVFTVLHHVRLE